MPLLTITVADSGATTRISSSVAELTCLHINQTNTGSYDPPDAPSPTPIAYNATETDAVTPQPTSDEAAQEGLTGGTIAGIAVGSVAATAILAGGLFFCLWRKKRAQKSVTNPHGGSGQEETKGEKAELPSDSNRYELEGPGPRELEGKDARHQLPATYEEGGKDNRQWLDGEEVQRFKLENQGPAELP